MLPEEKNMLTSFQQTPEPLILPREPLGEFVTEYFAFIWRFKTIPNAQCALSFISCAAF